jgi:monothiol glutaredoxin
MKKYNLSYEDRDIIGDPTQRDEMVKKSGQQLSPCVEIDGVMLPDISGAEVETYLLENNLVQPTTKEAEVATHAPCASHGGDIAITGLKK